VRYFGKEIEKISFRDRAGKCQYRSHHLDPQEAIMDYPFHGDPEFARRARVPVALWILAALVVTVLGAAVLGAASATDTRDFAARHATVLPSQAL
jgi:hypothetical protein